MAKIGGKSRRRKLLDPDKASRTNWDNASTCGGIGKKFGERDTCYQVNKRKNGNTPALIHPGPPEAGEAARFEQARVKESRAACTNMSCFDCSRECLGALTNGALMIGEISETAPKFRCTELRTLSVQLCAGGERRKNKKAYTENSDPVLLRESLDAGWFAGSNERGGRVLYYLLRGKIMNQQLQVQRNGSVRTQ
ncbi:hypothetical protein B0H13DRAFT_1915777 [Mycena leptocephala]|nr:hypothetical protein B0H13DRAFT_1915777 [Mycena leptocephala]